MDSTKVIADLCAVIDRMNVIIQAQAMELAQLGRWPTRRRSRPCGGSTPGPSVRGWDLEPGGNSAGRRRGATGSHDADPGGTDQGKSMVRHRKAIGRAINGEVIAKVDQLERDLEAMKAAQEERDAISCRSRILHFGDETIHGVRTQRSISTRSCGT